MSRTNACDRRRLARLVEMVLIALYRRVNALGSEGEERSHSAAIANVDANGRRQVGLTVLMVVVFGLGAAGMAIVTRRRRSAMTQAYEAVGERCTAQEALRANEGRFQSLVRRACDLTVVTDEFGIFRYVGPAAEALLGYPPEDLLGLALLNQVEAGERAQVGRAMELLAANPGSVHTIELRLCTRDGRVRLVEAVCQNLVEDPDVGGLVWNGRDVTDRRAFEDELSRQALHDPLTACRTGCCCSTG